MSIIRGRSDINATTGFWSDYSCFASTPTHYLQTADASVLNSIKRARGAGYEHRNRRGCLKGTRVALLEEIEKWSEDSDQPPIFWLNGLAGTGKSTIARTVAEQCFANGRLGASFFCSSDVTLRNHGNPGIVLPTLAFQLAQKYTVVRSTLVHHLRSNPDIAHESLENQAEKLIVEPLKSADVAMVIVIDALDECKDKEPSPAMVSVLGSIVRQVPKAKFFITSRPEPLLKGDFRHLERITRVSALHDIAPQLIDNDIRLFLKHELSELAARKGLDNWPTAAQLDLLCTRVAGHFAYAVATTKFLGRTVRMPSSRFAIIERSPDDTAHEGKVEGVHGGLSLDALCTSILQISFTGNSAEDDAMVRSVLAAAALFTPPFPPSAIPEAVREHTTEDIDMKEVMHILGPIHSLLELRDDPDHPVRPFHKLLSDCLTNPKRCSDPRFLVSRNSLVSACDSPQPSRTRS